MAAFNSSSLSAGTAVSGISTSGVCGSSVATSSSVNSSSSGGFFWISCIFERISSAILSASPSSMMPRRSSSLAQISRTDGWSRMISYIFGWV
jgi:hypothetical protein